MIEDFWNELNEGEIHLRDSLQFELKSEFFINPHLKTNIYRQEVFLFIPSPLQIDSRTYSKEQFYLDQTNLIRYKTPIIHLSDLINSEYSLSPLNRLQKYLNQSKPRLFFDLMSDELKLFGAIFRVDLREKVYQLITQLDHAKEEEKELISKSIVGFCGEITQVIQKFREIQDIAKNQSRLPQLIRHFKYIDEFISNVVDEFLIILLKVVRSSGCSNFSDVDNHLCQIILKEKSYRKKNHIGPKTTRGHLHANESILYRRGLLNRFVLECLMLKHFRFSLEEKHGQILGAAAAGVAMLVYMIFFVWQVSAFVITSFPFVALAVLFYILKDRIKEGFKILYYKKAHRWFPDYATEIRSPKGVKIGKLTENFTFIDPKQLPPGFLKIRNHDFHEELQALQRHETIIQYKREMVLNSPSSTGGRRRELTAIFRLNIHRFLEKASNPFQENLSLDSYTRGITEKKLPKVYHLNLIIRNTYQQSDFTPKVEIKTFRVVVDKSGIKRVEHIKHNP